MLMTVFRTCFSLSHGRADKLGDLAGKLVTGETRQGLSQSPLELLSLSVDVRIPPAPAPPAPPPPQPLAVGLAKEPRLCTQVKLVPLIFSLTKIFFVYCF